MDILSWLDGTQFWHWWILAAIFAGIEILAPGVFFIWLGAAAALTGVIALIIPGLGWELEALIFAVLAVVTVVYWRNRIKKGAGADDPAALLNRRGEQMIGRIAVLSEPIQNGRGKIKIDDSMWRVEGVDLPAGTQIKITGVDGAILKVEAAR
ncbi:MAG: NfeD family protein [Rhodospirillaceae bacterium]|nr:NfeD family protein [Rhodospirillaceae bacterium]